VFTLAPKKDAASPKTLADLSERAQAEIVQGAREAALRADPKATLKGQELGELFATKIVKNADDPDRNWTVLTRRIAISIDYIRKYDALQAPADRLARTRVDLKLDDANRCLQPAGPENCVRFTTFSKLENARRSIDIADLKFDQTNSIAAKAGLATLTPDLASLDISPTFSRSLNETLKLKEDQLQIYGSMTEKSVFYVEQGAPLTDLGGMTFLDVVVSFPRRAETPFGVEEFDAATSKLTGGVYSLPDPSYCTSDVRMSGSIDAIIRHVEKGAETYIEGDDTVLYIEKTVPKSTIVLIPAHSVTRMPIWELSSASARIVVRPAKTFDFDASFFTSQEAAVKLVTWLAAQTASAPGSSDPILLDNYEVHVFAADSANVLSGQARSDAVDELLQTGPVVSRYDCRKVAVSGR
jgi:hypothetical protein